MEERQERKLAKSVVEDFERRRASRKRIERCWQMNMNFVSGAQYCDVTPDGELFEESSRYFWQKKRVFNHIAPIVDARIARLEKDNPALSVSPASDEESDLRAAELAQAILTYAAEEGDLKKAISTGISWCEVCGTVFYKVIWNDERGMAIGLDGEKVIRDGCTEIIPLSPFEIYPDDLGAKDLSEVDSLIHAKAMSVTKIKELFGVEVAGREISDFSLSPYSSQTGGNATLGGNKNKKKNQEIVIERYTRPTEGMPLGELIIVAGERVLYQGELPYLNGRDGERDFPFVMQRSILLPGSFFGGSVVDRMIPLQRAYNALRNRKHEFINRLTLGVLAVEDGSLDTDELAESGLEPGSVVVYRQGTPPPEWLPVGEIPAELSKEEERLEEEFLLLGETNEISRSTLFPSNVTSATGLKILLEQYSEKLGGTISEIQEAAKSIGRQILRLFKQFSENERLVRLTGNGKESQSFFFTASAVMADDVILRAERRNSPADVRDGLMNLFQMGLLSDENGKISEENKNRLLTALGFASFAATKDLTSLHEDKAREENIRLLTESVTREEFDDDEVHIREHTRFLLSNEFSKRKDEAMKQRFLSHLREHKNQIQ